MKCLMEEQHGTRHEKLCLMKCHQGFAHSDQISSSINPQIEDPQKQYERCQKGCEKYRGEKQREPKQLCQERCKEQLEELRRQQQEREQGEVIPGPEKVYKECLGQCNEETQTGSQGQGEEEQNNPYVFRGQMFKSRVRTEAGDFKVLQRFSKQSELLNGIDNYRLAIYESDPNTFIVPHHCDADVIAFVARGEGTISFVHRERRETFDLERGDAIRIPAGSTAYLVNRHNNEKFRVFMLLRPVNTPGRFKGFFGAGGKEKQSYYNVFSNDILEAAFNTPRDQLERLFGGRQAKGIIVRASQEQIRALSQKGHEGSSKHHHGRKSRGPFNLFSQKPAFCNNYGQLFRASPDDYKQLEDLDVSVGVMNIAQGAMVAPYFNSRSTILVFVNEGNGYFEMACPHLASQSQPSGGQQQQQEEEEQGINHPISIVSTGNQNLQLVGFGINARNNHHNFLAGQDNIWNNVESEAKELTFGVQSREISSAIHVLQGFRYSCSRKKKAKAMTIMNANFTAWLSVSGGLMTSTLTEMESTNGVHFWDVTYLEVSLSNNELLLIIRQLCVKNSDDNFGRVINFRVIRLDVTKLTAAVPMVDLSSNDIKPNCIYFSDDSIKSYVSGTHPLLNGGFGGLGDMGVYNVENHSFGRFSNVESFPTTCPCPPLWVTPSL
ncbi:OLC1v1019987C1 [Oldenlandia corymbosa var. corymbosa]|uniref:OLC1v1019987C1 n=1 Tax=Oldenlandia corymbosa var. corymbosa TaxID=529605 RepID=A0AAV1EFS4_OLDCO|nr:OLC1v1019987C1 [Oldenlandia corymbosa var. corymbosa]